MIGRHWAARLSLLGVFVVACSDGGPPPLSEIVATPSEVALSFLGETRTITTTITDESGATRTDVELSWSSNNTSAVTVSPTGVVTAAGNGTATVQASAGGVASNPVTVVVSQTASSVEIAGGDVALSFLGETVSLSASATDQGGSEIPNPDFTWSSTNTNVASVSSTGTVEAVGTGTVTIRARLDGVNSPGISVTVRQIATEVSIVGSGSLAFSFLGETAQLEVDARDAGGSQIEDPATEWVSDNPSAVTVTQTGTLEAVANGSAQITATVGDVTSSPLATTVEQVAVVVTVDPEILTIQEVGGTGQLTATALDAGDSSVEGAEFSWESSADEVVTVEPTGSTVIVTAVAEGSAEITARSGEVVSEPAAVGVGAPPVPTVQPGERVVGLSASAGDQLFYRIEVPAGTGELAVGIGGGSGDADLFVRRGELPTTEDFDCVSGFSDNNELCEITNPEPGDWFVMVYAFDDYSQVDFLAIARSGDPRFNIDLVFDDNVDEAVRTATTNAAERWEAVLPADLQGFWVYFFDTCGIGDFDLSDPVDDMRVRIQAVSIDGQGGTLARAGWCLRRLVGNPDGPLPVVGVIQVDLDDLGGTTPEALEETLLHELGHALGFGGEIWETVDPPLIEGAGTDDPIFTGAGALQAFDDVGGTEYDGAKVPLENEGGEGTRDGHWRESVFDDELMTGFAESGTEKLSIVTIRAMEDLGWTVDVSQADAYALPGGSGSAARESRGERSVPLNDLMVVPQYGIDREGRIVELKSGGR